jgi:hypothetical protein
VGGAVLRQPQDSKRTRLLFGFATFLFARYGVATGFSPHTQHSSMYDWSSCGCGSMLKALKNSQEKNSAEKISVK